MTALAIQRVPGRAVARCRVSMLRPPLITLHALFRVAVPRRCFNDRFPSLKDASACRPQVSLKRMERDVRLVIYGY
jgi:hypothetical protein